MPDPSSKSPYSAKFKNEQRRRLLAERESVIEGIEGDYKDLRSWSGHDDTGIDQHMADDATALTEQELDVTLIDNASHIVHEIDEALHRIEKDTYGWDYRQGCWIREERLKALPWARREIEEQRKLEDRMKHNGRGSYDFDVPSL